METEIVKGKPLTKEETSKLLELIENSKIFSLKATNAPNNKMKNEEWSRVTRKFNATYAHCPRTAQQLKLKWENLKKSARKRNTRIRMSLNQTGDGPADYVPPDKILDRVIYLLGNTTSGFIVPFGGDSEPVGFNFDVGATTFTNTSTGSDCGSSGGSSSSFRGTTVVEYKHCPDDDDDAVVDSDTAVSLNLGKRKNSVDESREARNIAIAKYYEAKRKCMELQYETIKLQNEKLKLEIENEKNKKRII